MVARRRSRRARRWFTAVLPLVTLAGATLLITRLAPAQVSGDVLVGRIDDPLAAPDGEPAVPGELAEPRAVTLPQPAYPRAARAARQEGRVMVCFTLDERGRVRAPAVRSSTDAVFNQPVLDAISAARFTPATVSRQPVRSTACRTFLFVLR